MDRDDLLDLLADLQHDLGKYIRQPLAFLPEGASPALVREALDTALRRTRRTPRGVRGVRDIWAEALDEGEGALRALAGFAAVERAVEGALAWEAALDGGEIIDRTRALADVSAVATALRALIDEVEADT